MTDDEMVGWHHQLDGHEFEHRRGKVCSRLSLFSPLFRARAWRCLRLGLAFCVVDIPESGLLAQIISLR